MSRNRMAQWLVAVVVGFAASAAKADTVTYVTPAGSTTTGGPVNTSATFTTSANFITIGLTNLLANPINIAQCISDLAFTVSNGTLAASTLFTSSGQEITVNSNGTFSLGSTVATQWNYMPGFLDDLGGGKPSHLIIGPPDGSNLYSNANGSIAGNGPHNPLLNQSASFVIFGPGITANTHITSVTFSFGTTPDSTPDDVPGILTTTPVPAPPALVLGLIGVAGLFGMRAWPRQRTPEMA
jgi:hypothetical protein